MAIIPFLVFGAWWTNRRRDVPGTSEELLIPVRVSRVIAVLGGLSVLTALFLFVFPGRAAAVWPWMLTPLIQVAALMLALILAAGARDGGELDPSNAMTWLIGAGFTAVLAAIAVMYARMQAQTASGG